MMLAYRAGFCMSLLQIVRWGSNEFVVSFDISLISVTAIIILSYQVFSWLSFMVSNCECATFPLVSWVGCGT